MKKILLPLDGTDRSLNTLEWVKRNFYKEDVELYLVSILEDYDFVSSVEDAEFAKSDLNDRLIEYKELIKDFSVHTICSLGRAGEEIVSYANVENVDMIVMTKSTRPGWTKILGSVTTYVVQHAKCDVLIISEQSEK